MGLGVALQPLYFIILTMYTHTILKNNLYFKIKHCFFIKYCILLLLVLSIHLCQHEA